MTGRKLVADARLDGTQVHLLVFLLKHTTAVQRCTAVISLESVGQLDSSSQLNMHPTMQTCLIDEEERGEETLQTGVIKQSHTSVPVSTRNRLARQKVVAADESLAKAVVLASDERERERESERGEGRRGATDHTDTQRPNQSSKLLTSSLNSEVPPPSVCWRAVQSPRSSGVSQQQQPQRFHSALPEAAATAEENA